MNRSAKSRFVLIILPLLCSFSAAQSETVLLPSRAGAGNTTTLLPFGLYMAGYESMRYQQVFSGAPFSAIHPQGVWIQKISFTSELLFGSDQPRFQVNLSTTVRQRDELSLVFAENVANH